MKDSLYAGIIVGIIAMVLGFITVIAEDKENINRIENRIVCNCEVEKDE